MRGTLRLPVGAQVPLPGSYNSALLLDHSGQAAGRYDKVRLLAFGEYIPGIDLFPWLRNLLPPGTGRFKAGAGPGIMPLQAGDGAGHGGGKDICDPHGAAENPRPIELARRHQRA